MVVDDPNVTRALVPTEHDAPLVVDPDGVAACEVALQGLQPIAGRHAEVCQAVRGIEVLQLSTGDLAKLGWKSPACPRLSVKEQVLRELAFERYYHVIGTR